MLPDDYLTALKKLGLTPASKITAAALGMSVRQIQKYATGEAAVPAAVARLLDMYRRHGLPD